jgi:hypothetical protein
MSVPPYHYVRWTWWKTYSVTDLVSTLKDRFTVTLMKQIPGQDEMISLNRRDTPFMEVKADTLSVYIAPSKAVLFQKEGAPFTERDLELRKILLELYGHATPAPLPLFYRAEPPFQTREKGR